MAEFNENNNLSNDVVSGVEPVRRHSAAKAAGIITASVLVVAAGGSAIAYNVSDFVKNQVKLRISSPENYYAWVTEKNSSEIASQIADSYRDAIEELKNGQHSRLSVTYSVGDEFKKILLEDLYEDETDAMNAINDLKDITLGVDAYQKEESVSGNIFTQMNGEEIISLDVAADLNATALFFRLPALSEQWIMASDVIDIDYDEVGEKFASDPESVITPDELESLITKYSELYSSLVSDITIEKKEEVAVGDFTANYTVAEYTLDKQSMTEMAEKFSTAMKEDELLRSILVDRTGAMTDEEYDSELNSMSENIDSSYNETVRTYIDANGDIRGFVVDENSDGTDDVRFIMGRENTKTYAELVAVDDGEEVFRTDIELNEADGVYDGTLNYRSGSDDIKIGFKNASLVGDKNYINADVVFTYFDYLDEERNVPISLSSDGGSQKISGDIIIEDKNYGSLTVEYSTENGAEPSIPDAEGAYDITSDDADFPRDYVDREKMVEFIENFYVKIGLGKETAHDYALTLAEGIYRTYNDMMDFDYPEIEINGWDADDENYDYDDLYFDYDTDDLDLFWEGIGFDGDEGFAVDPDGHNEDDFDISDLEISLDRVGEDDMAVY